MNMITDDQVESLVGKIFNIYHRMKLSTKILVLAGIVFLILAVFSLEFYALYQEKLFDKRPPHPWLNPDPCQFHGALYDSDNYKLIGEEHIRKASKLLFAKSFVPITEKEAGVFTFNSLKPVKGKLPYLVRGLVYKKEGGAKILLICQSVLTNPTLFLCINQYTGQNTI